MQYIILAITWIVTALWSILKTWWNAIKDISKIILDFLLTHWLKILIWGAFWWIALSLMSTLLAFVLYHLSLTLTLFVSGFVTPFTAWLIVNFTLWIFFLFIGRFILSLFR